MYTLYTIFLVSFMGAVALIVLKARELHIGRAIIFPRFRTALDASLNVLPAFLSRERQLFLARFSLKLHELSVYIHNFSGSARAFFRRHTIRLFASARHISDQNGEHRGVSYYLRRLSERHPR